VRGGTGERYIDQICDDVGQVLCTETAPALRGRLACDGGRVEGPLDSRFQNKNTFASTRCAVNLRRNVIEPDIIQDGGAWRDFYIPRRFHYHCLRTACRHTASCNNIRQTLLKPANFKLYTLHVMAV
jgi:hypothetical protein